MTVTFRTVDVSDPVGGLPGLHHVTVKSAALGRRADVSVYAPPGVEELPVVILLHGVYGSHWDWLVNGRAQQVLDGLLSGGEVRPMALAMPSDGLRGDGSGYLPNTGEDAQAFIVEEIAQVAALVNPAARGPVFIAGLSMGGFGALRLAATHPGRFAAAAGMSSVTHLEQLAALTEEGGPAYTCPPGEESLARVLSTANPTTPFRFDCGLDDPFLGANRELHAALVSAGVEHPYSEHPGGHDWDYWRSRLPDVLRFFDSRR